MASRHIKRLQAQAQSEAPDWKAKKGIRLKDPLAAQAAVGSSEDEEEDGAAHTAAPFNPFDLLSEDDTPALPSDSDNDDADSGGAQADTAGASPAASAGKLPATARRKAAKKTKKGKKLKGPKAAEVSDGEGPATAADGQDGEDIDKLVKELNLTTVGAVAEEQAASAAAAAASSAVAAGPSHLLAVDIRSLRGDDELRRIFGADVIQNVDREDVADAADRRRRTAAVRGQAGRRRPNKKALLTVPKEHWPPLDTGLSMTYVGMVNGRQTFKYLWSPSYWSKQQLFQELQATFDPNQIAALLHQAPYHLEALLTMYDLYRHMGENAYAEEVLGRALYALEMAWHPNFNISTAACRLSFEVAENQPMFIALFRHVQALSRQGCHSTALECCKLLLALDPEDPMGALGMLDYLALRAGRYDYLQRFVAGFEGNRSLGLLPNYSYSLALAAFRKEVEAHVPIGYSVGPTGSSPTGDRSSHAASTSGSQSSSSLPAFELLLQAILLHPLVIPRILAKLSEKGVGREAHWTSLLQRKLFAQASDEGSASLGHLVTIYCERNHLLWKAPDALEFLRSGAAQAADIADGKKKDSALNAEDWACLRQESFPASEVNEHRHQRLHDYTDNVNALPREEMQEAMQAGGRIGVEDAMAEVQEQILLAAQMAAAEQAQQAAAAGGGRGRVPAAAMSEEELRQANPVMMLLRSLLPWEHLGAAPENDAGADDEIDEEIDGDAVGR